jgi:hypothetical protein
MSGCNAWLNPRKVARHFKRVHPTVHANQQVGKASKWAQPRPPKSRKVGAASQLVSNIFDETATSCAPQEKNLDVTKPYAHVYRETGRYGSHPSHDGFDDESGPE